MMGLLIFLAIGLVLVVWIVALYNALVMKRNGFKNAFSQIDVQLKRRYDLIPNLVETAKGYMKFERETLEAVTKARNEAHAVAQKAAANPADGSAIRALAGAETALTGALGKFYAVMENYPDLKASRNMSQLMEELTSTENKVAFARQAYNDAVMSYNNSCQMFPSSIIAGGFGFAPAQLLEITNEAERQAVKVSF
jgi:LemA protein